MTVINDDGIPIEMPLQMGQFQDVLSRSFLKMLFRRCYLLFLKGVLQVLLPESIDQIKKTTKNTRRNKASVLFYFSGRSRQIFGLL